MEEDRNLRCPENVVCGEGHYDPEGPGDPDSDGHPLCAGCGCLWSKHSYECKGCGRIEILMTRRLYRGALYKDAIDDEPYCIVCSGVFYEMAKRPDGVVREGVS